MSVLKYNLKTNKPTANSYLAANNWEQNWRKNEQTMFHHFLNMMDRESHPVSQFPPGYRKQIISLEEKDERMQDQKLHY